MLEVSIGFPFWSVTILPEESCKYAFPLRRRGNCVAPDSSARCSSFERLTGANLESTETAHFLSKDGFEGSASSAVFSDRIFMANCTYCWSVFLSSVHLVTNNAVRNMDNGIAIVLINPCALESVDAFIGFGGSWEILDVSECLAFTRCRSVRVFLIVRF